jgi:hypothetical protein
MSLIELIVYIALLATFLTSAVFSAYSILMSVMHDSDRVNQEQIRDDRGFVAIISAVTIATMLLLAAVGASTGIGERYDSVMHSESRMVVRGWTYSCFDRAVAKLSQDYFYRPPVDGEVVAVSRSQLAQSGTCSIDSVSVPADSGSKRDILVSVVYQGIHGQIRGEVLLSVYQIRVLYQNFILF